MFCNFCGKNQAVLHINQKVDGTHTELHLCSSCVQEQGIDLSNQFSVADIIAGISNFSPSSIRRDALVCDFCDMTYEDFCMLGRFGCGNCYRHFDEHLPNLFTNIQGSVIHKGKMPFEIKKMSNTRGNLQKELASAIESENYERAAQIRDLLKEMDNEF